MNWPEPVEFAAALRIPESAFRDLALRDCRFTGPRGQGPPEPIIGAFAAVFRAAAPAGRRDLAVRVFLRPPHGLAERYELAHQYLSRRQGHPLLGFRFEAEGLRFADGRAFPIVVMDWVEGGSLGEVARALCASGDREGLQALASQWDGLLRELGELGIAHGDLNARNALVDEEGELRLIDYDVICVPSLAGRTAPEIELEDNACQHPGRSLEMPLTTDLDTFAGLVVRLELLALAADPSLLGRFGSPGPASASLLLSAADLRDPMTSRLFNALVRSEEPEVRRMAELVSHLYEFPPDALPALREVVQFGPAARRPSDLLESPARLAREATTLTATERAALSRRVRVIPPPPAWLGLELSRHLPPLERDDRRQLNKVRWTWPESDLCRNCVVTVSARAPGERDQPQDLAALRRWTVSRDADRPFVIHPEESWRGATVAVWGEIDLGFLKFHTAPLNLGTLGEEGARRGGIRSLFERMTGKRPASP